MPKKLAISVVRRFATPKYQTALSNIVVLKQARLMRCHGNGISLKKIHSGSLRITLTRFEAHLMNPNPNPVPSRWRYDQDFRPALVLNVKFQRVGLSYNSFKITLCKVKSALALKPHWFAMIMIQNRPVYIFTGLTHHYTWSECKVRLQFWNFHNNHNEASSKFFWPDLKDDNKV